MKVVVFLALIMAALLGASLTKCVSDSNSPDRILTTDGVIRCWQYNGNRYVSSDYIIPPGGKTVLIKVYTDTYAEFRSGDCKMIDQKYIGRVTKTDNSK